MCEIQVLVISCLCFISLEVLATKIKWNLKSYPNYKIHSTSFQYLYTFLLIYITSLQPWHRSRLQYQSWTPECALEVVLQKDCKSQSLKLLKHWSERLFPGLSNAKGWQMSGSNCRSHSFLIGHVDLLMFLINKDLFTKTKSHRRWFLPSTHTYQNRQKVV